VAANAGEEAVEMSTSLAVMQGLGLFGTTVGIAATTIDIIYDYR